MFDKKQTEALTAKLDASHVKARTQAGRQLSYIEGWHAIAEANRIFGFSEWDRTLVTLKQVTEPREIDGKWRVSYLATVRITVRTIDGQDVVETVRDGTGYGSGIDRDLGSAHESAIKEAETDAMKRALMTFGNPFGLALYDKTQENVETHRPSAPMPGRNAPPSNDRTSNGGGAPLSAQARLLTVAAAMAMTKQEVTDWVRANGDAIDALPGDEPDRVREHARALYTRLPDKVAA
jgi:DNA repair and recombination protein RAD52